MTYSTFDELSDDVLRLDFIPESIVASGKPLARVSAADQEGYSFDEKTRVLRIHHEHANHVDIQGKDGAAPMTRITFDDPHLAAMTPLNGRYPDGVIDWGEGQWMIHPPAGKFGTFNVSLRDPALTHAAFAFPVPMIFAGLDAYNGGSKPAVLRLRSPQIREQTYTLQPGQLLRIRTGWRDRSTSVEFDFENGEGLRFDNMAYDTSYR